MTDYSELVGRLRGFTGPSLPDPSAPLPVKSAADAIEALQAERDEAQKWYEREAEAGSERERERDHWKARAERAEATLRRSSGQAPLDLGEVLSSALDHQEGEQ